MTVLENKVSTGSMVIACYVDQWIDEYVDNLINNEYNRKRNLLKYLKVSKTNKRDCLPVIEACDKFRNELHGVLVEKDPDLIEGYSFLSDAKLKKLSIFVDELCSDLRIYTLRSSKKKKRSPEVMLKKFKYMELMGNVESFDPSELFACKSFIAYNTKTNELYYYETTEQFTITGTTLHGFDSNASYCQKVRRKTKPVTEFTVGTVGRVIKEMDKIKTKKNLCTGRFNINTMLLRVLS